MCEWNSFKVQGGQCGVSCVVLMLLPPLAFEIFLPVYIRCMGLEA